MSSRGAQQAVSRSAYTEAASMLDAALKLFDKLREGAERLRTELAFRSIEAMAPLSCTAPINSLIVRAPRWFSILGGLLYRSRWISSTSTPCGAWTKAILVPGVKVTGSTVKWAPLLFSSATAASRLSTVNPMCSKPK